MEEVNEEYENRMLSYEIDCNDGKGDLLSCHRVGEFFAVVKSEFERAAKVYEQNCNRDYNASCFNLGRLYRKI